MEDELDEFLYGNEGPAKAAEAADESAEMSVEDGDGEAEVVEPKEEEEEDAKKSEDDDEEESDDDLEIVLDDSGNDLEASGKTQEKREAMQLVTSTGGDAQNITDGDEQKMDEVVALKGHININGIGEFEGRQILEIDLDQIDDKPWRKPGADITDFFNYGFTENTWRAYCIKQKQMREEFGLSKKTDGNYQYHLHQQHQQYIPQHYQQPQQPSGQQQQQQQQNYYNQQQQQNYRDENNQGYHGGSGGRGGRDRYRRRSRSPPQNRSKSRDNYNHGGGRYGRRDASVESYSPDSRRRSSREYHYEDRRGRGGGGGGRRY